MKRKVKITRQLNRLIGSKKHRYVLLLLLTPALWWIFFRFDQVVDEWQKIPFYFNRKVESVFSLSNLRYILDLRWETVAYDRNDLYSRAYYNKATLVTGEFFSFLTYLSPKFYFQSSDGWKLLPPGIEAIPIVLFPFWIFGILKLIKEKHLKPFLMLFIFGMAAFLVGQKNFHFLFPIILVNLYLTNEGLGLVKDSKKIIFIFLILLVYSSFLIGRGLWLTL